MAEMTEYAPGTPCWVDLQTSNVEKGADFYSKVFGWGRQDLGAEYGGYGFFLKNGKMVGGVGPKMGPGPSAWSTYVSVADADATVAKARESGGTVVVEPMDVGTMGRQAFFVDTAGAAIGVWQPRDGQGAELANEAGTFGWNECQTRDVEAAKAFYSAVFGWKPTTFENMDNYVVFENDGRGIAGCMTMPAMVHEDIPSYWLTYFGVDDTDASAQAAAEQGGTVLTPPMDIPTVGRFAVIADPQGAVFAIIKPIPPTTS